jgi:hypothetical protein
MTDAETEGTYLVTHAEADSAILRDVADGQVHTLADNPGVEEGEALAATLAPDPPLEVTWRLVEVHDRRGLSVERSPEPPTVQERDIAGAQDEGEITIEERAGIGELHVLTVPEDRTEAAVADVIEDEATLVRAAGMEGVTRVEVRADAGVVSVRYLP